MITDQPDVSALEDPQGKLERAFIDEFLRSHGYHDSKRGELSDLQIERLMKQATAYASGKLSEVEARARFVHEIHGADYARQPQRR